MCMPSGNNDKDRLSVHVSNLGKAKAWQNPSLSQVNFLSLSHLYYQVLYDPVQSKFSVVEIDQMQLEVGLLKDMHSLKLESSRLLSRWHVMYLNF